LKNMIAERHADFVPVILGANITSYGLARAFHEQYGISSIVLSSEDGKYISHSKIIENVIRPGLDDRDRFVEALLELASGFPEETKLLALASGDTNARLLIENRQALSRYIIPYIPEEILNRIVFKDCFYGYCEKLGIPYPKTVVFDNQREEAPPDPLPFDYPIVLKPSDSSQFKCISFAGQKKVYIISGREELLTELDRAKQAGYKGTFVLQDMIPGDDTNLFVLTCYCDSNSDVVFSSLGRVLLEDPTPQAMGNHVSIVNEVNEQVVRDAAKFLKEVGYTGFANFDLKYDERDNTYKFFEINVRLGRSNYYITGSGFNAVRWIVDDLIYHKSLPTVVANKEHLYTNILKQQLLGMLTKEKEKDRVRRLYREGKVSNPLVYKKDRSLVRNFYVYLALLNYIRKFRRYRPQILAKTQS